MSITLNADDYNY